MARPPKDGFDYFPVDVQFDDKVKALKIIFKNDGTAWFLQFWQKAYQTIAGSVDLRSPYDIVFAQECNITIERHKEILALALKVELCYAISEGVYTSNGIQKRIEKILKERKFDKERKNINRKVTGTYPTGKLNIRPENSISDRKTPGEFTSKTDDPDDPIPGTPEYSKAVEDEISNGKAIVESINKKTIMDRIDKIRRGNQTPSGPEQNNEQKS